MSNVFALPTQAAEDRSVAIVIYVSGNAPLLAEVLESCIAQTVRPAEILVVGAGSPADLQQLAADFPAISVHRQANRSRDEAQRAALASVSTEFIVFLDADERLTSNGVEVNLECFDKNPNAWLVNGAHRVFDAAGRSASPVWQERLHAQTHQVVGGLNFLALQASAMYRTECLRSIMGVNLTSKTHCTSTCFQQIVTHSFCVAEYRFDKQIMLTRSMVITPKEKGDSPVTSSLATQVEQGLLFHHNAPQMFATAAKELIRNGWNSEAARIMLRTATMAPLPLVKVLASRTATAIIRRLPRPLGRLCGEALWSPAVGSVRFGDFGRTRPISNDYGFDRGKPLDRYYIEGALRNCSELVRGRVLEVGGREYTELLGGDRVESSDVLDINPLNPAATVIGDLGAHGALPVAAFDCIILTQTLQLIRSMENAVDNLFQALAPNGALLVTAPGISPIGPDELRYWYWTFTELSLKSLLAGRFGENNVQVESYGNVFAAICFLTGLSLAEVGTDRLDFKDGSYPVTIFACARKSH